MIVGHIKSQLYSLAAKAWGELHATPLRTAVFRYATVLGTVTAVTQLLHRIPLANPLSGILSMATVLLCAWLGGVGPALLLTPLIFVIARLHRDQEARWAAINSQELMAIAIIATLSVSVGLAGQFRRRIRAVTQQHAQKLRDQARALSQASILFRDLNGRITEWNEGTQRLFGWTSAEAVGQLARDLLETRFPRSPEQVHEELITEGQWHGEVTCCQKDGNQLSIATHWILYKDTSGQPIGVAEIYNDVSDLRRAEAAVREADRRKDEFLAMLAHELRNPLAPIRTGLELFKLAGDDPQIIADTREIMERQLRQLVTLVDDLLDVSRITRGKLELRKCQTSISDVVKSAVEATMPTLDAAGHCLSVAVPEVPIFLDADPNRLAQVLSNLLDNAIKYTPDGGRIWLAAEPEGNDVIVSIKDTGIGVPPEMLGRIFEMFTRSEHGADQMYAGLGIGLALVKSIVEMHDGTVTAHSDGIGHGTEIRLRLPIAVEWVEPIQQPSNSMEREITGSRRVLVVDDNQAAADLLSTLVKQLGNQVCVANDGQQAIDMALRFQPDVVLMDLGMPKMDGYAAARHIRQQPWGRDLLLIALTGWGQDGHKRRTREAGFDHHLVKPADPAMLKGLLAGNRRNLKSAGPVDPVVE